MATPRGWLDSHGTPLVRVGIFPPGRPSPSDKFDAVIDTGFTGFAQIPATSAESTGRRAAGTTDYTYADGAREPVPIAYATVRLGDEMQDGFVVLSEGGDVLVGIEFLRLFRKSLTVSVRQGLVTLTDE
jgi:predicted aspartyl protease